MQQSWNVKLFGRRTAGALDYSNLRPHKLPSGKRLVLYATSRSTRLPHLPVDAVGVLPDVFLPLPAGAAEREREIDRVRTLLEQKLGTHSLTKKSQGTHQKFSYHSATSGNSKSKSKRASKGDVFLVVTLYIIKVAFGRTRSEIRMMWQLVKGKGQREAMRTVRLQRRLLRKMREPLKRDVDHVDVGSGGWLEWMNLKLELLFIRDHLGGRSKSYLRKKTFNLNLLNINRRTFVTYSGTSSIAESLVSSPLCLIAESLDLWR